MEFFEKLTKKVTENPVAENLKENIKDRPVKTVGGLGAMAVLAGGLTAIGAEVTKSPDMFAPAENSYARPEMKEPGQQEAIQVKLEDKIHQVPGDSGETETTK